jgi:transposase-like protein
MPKRYPPEFKRDVVTIARRGGLSGPEVAVDFDVADESVRRWMRQADIDDGIAKGQTSGEQSELVQLCWRMSRLEMENEVLRRPAAYFAQCCLPDECSGRCSRRRSGVRLPVPCR